MLRLRLHRPLPAALLALALAPAAAGAATSQPPMAAARGCDLVAAPGGSDGAAGTAAAPLRTASRLVARLHAGQTGCLRSGLYDENVTVRTAGITLTSAPGERATIRGRFWVPAGADGVTVSDLNLDGVNATTLPSPTVNANSATFLGNDVTNDHTAICFVLGSSWGRAAGTVIRGNRIHDCGKLPSQNLDHGIYVAEADDTQIIDNVIVDNADRGVQLYPDAQRTLVRGNIIQGNGEGVLFAGAGGTASSSNVVTGNVISGSVLRNDVESYYPAGNVKGVGNVVTGNCVGRVNTRQGGFSAAANVSGTPSFLALRSGDLRLAASPCAAVLGASAAPAGLNWQTPFGGAWASPPAPPATGGAPGAGTTPRPSTRAPGRSAKPRHARSTRTSRRKHGARIARCHQRSKRSRAACAKAAKTRARRRRAALRRHA